MTTSECPRETTPVRLGLSMVEGARSVGLSRARFYEIVMSGEIRSVKTGGRRIVPVAAIERWLAEQSGASA